MAAKPPRQCAADSTHGLEACDQRLVARLVNRLALIEPREPDLRSRRLAAEAAFALLWRALPHHASDAALAVSPPKHGFRTWILSQLTRL